MRKWLVVLLCLTFLLGIIGCSDSTDTITSSDGTEIQIKMPNKIPKDFSEEFYRDMLFANELIKKSIITGYPYINKDFTEKYMEYHFILNKDNLNEDNEEYIKKNKLNINKNLTDKETYTLKIFYDLNDYLSLYCETKKKDLFINEVESKHKQFKALLEIEEPK